MAQITVANAGVTFACDEQDTILRAALREGLGLAYECNVGSCGSCRFEVLSGSLEHLRGDPPALTDRDRQRNRMLGCQARPLGDCTIKVPVREDYRSLHRPARTSAVLLGTEDHTHDIREFRFRLAIPNGFRPGQYALIEVPGLDGGRAYSMCNTAGDGAEWHFQIKRVPDGAATTRLFDTLRPGDSVTIDGPYGMAFLREESGRDILCIAGGSGLSPMISIARAVASDTRLADRTLHFIYGGRAARDIAGEAMLRDLPGFGQRIHYHAAVSMPDSDAGGAWSGPVGFVHEIVADLWGARLSEFEIYFAGPPAMADALLKVAAGKKVPFAQIHFDRFY